MTTYLTRDEQRLAEQFAPAYESFRSSSDLLAQAAQDGRRAELPALQDGTEQRFEAATAVLGSLQALQEVMAAQDIAAGWRRPHIWSGRTRC